MNKNFYICACNVIYQEEEGKLLEYHTLGEDISDDVCIINEITNCKGWMSLICDSKSYYKETVMIKTLSISKAIRTLVSSITGFFTLQTKAMAVRNYRTANTYRFRQFLVRRRLR